MNTLEILKHGRQQVAKGWTQGAEAEDIDGNARGATDPKAVCWCAMGALWHSGAPYASVAAARDALKTTLRLADIDLVAGWNDDEDRTQADVLAAFDATIARLEKGQ